MIHLALWILSALFVAAVCLAALLIGYALLRALLRVLASLSNKAVDIVVALVFCLLILPPLWAWEKWRRWVRRRRWSRQ